MASNSGGNLQRLDRLSRSKPAIGRLDLPRRHQGFAPAELELQRERFEAAAADEDADFEHVIMIGGDLNEHDGGHARPADGRPFGAGRAASVCPWLRKNSASACSMYRKKFVKCTIPAMSVSTNSTRRLVTKRGLISGSMRPSIQSLPGRRCNASVPRELLADFHQKRQP